MNIICWNLQLNNGSNIDEKAAQNIALEIYNQTQTPFVFFILENKGAPEQVAQTIRNAIDMRHSYLCFDLGGSIHTHENAVCIYGGAGVTVKEYTKLAISTSSGDTGEHDDEPEVSSSSSSGFTSKVMSNLDRSLRRDRWDIIRKNVMNANAARKAYPLRGERPKKEIPVFHAAERVRSPLVVDVTCGTFRVRVAVLHAPGPGAKPDHEAERLAQTYFGDVMPVCMGAQVDVVIGDFNLYRSPSVTAYFEEVPLNAGTTYGKKESKLDRIFVRRNRFLFETRVLGPEKEEPYYTDHKAVALRNFGTAASPATVRTQTPRPTIASSSSSSSFRRPGGNQSKMRRIDADDE